MTGHQLSRDLRVVGVDLGCAAIGVLVWGVAGVGSWLGRYRQDVAADRAQRVLDAERLAEDGAEIDVWEPCSNQGSLDAIDALKGAMWCSQHQTTTQFCSDLRHSSQAPVHPADAKHHGGHRFSLRADGVSVEPIPSYETRLCEVHDHPDPKPCVACCNVCNAPCGCPCGYGSSPAQHLSAGGAVGPEAVSGQPPASGQPTAPEELEDSDLLYTAAGALVVYADKHGDIPSLINELRDRAAQFAAFERRHK